MASDNHDDIVMYGGLALVAYFGLQQILKALGSDPQSTATVQNQVLAPADESPFNVQYQPAVDLFAANPSYNSDGSIMTMPQYYQILKQWYDDSDPNLKGNAADTARWAETIKGALSAWNLVTDSNAIMGVFSQLSNKIQVANIAAYFLYNFNSDLLAALQGSIFKAGLTDQNLATVINEVDNLN